MTERAPIRDCGPEFGRRLGEEMRRFARAFADAAARASSAREAGALAQAEAAPSPGSPTRTQPMRAADLAIDLPAALAALTFAIGAPLGAETIRFLFS